MQFCNSYFCHQLQHFSEAIKNEAWLWGSIEPAFSHRAQC